MGTTGNHCFAAREGQGGSLVHSVGRLRKGVEDRSIEMGEGAYGKLLGALASIEKWDLMERISKRWLELQPNSIPAWQWRVRSLRKIGKVDEAVGLERSRLVEVEFVVKDRLLT